MPCLVEVADRQHNQNGAHQATDNAADDGSHGRAAAAAAAKRPCAVAAGPLGVRVKVAVLGVHNRDLLAVSRLVAARVGHVPHAEEVEAGRAPLGNREVARVVRRLVEDGSQPSVAHVLRKQLRRRMWVEAPNDRFARRLNKLGRRRVRHAQRLLCLCHIAATVGGGPFARQRVVASTPSRNNSLVHAKGGSRARVDSLDGVGQIRAAVGDAINGHVRENGRRRVRDRDALRGDGRVAALVRRAPRAHEDVRPSADDALLGLGHCDSDGTRVAIVRGRDRRGGWHGRAADCRVRRDTAEDGRLRIAIDDVLVEAADVAARVRRAVLAQDRVVGSATAREARLHLRRLEVRVHVVRHGDVGRLPSAREIHVLAAGERRGRLVADRHLLADVVEVAALVRGDPTTRKRERVGARAVDGRLEHLNRDLLGRRAVVGSRELGGSGSAARRLDLGGGRHVEFRRDVVDNVHVAHGHGDVAAAIHCPPRPADTVAVRTRVDWRALRILDAAGHVAAVVDRRHLRRVGEG
eukprot:Opistho-1_new@24887